MSNSESNSIRAKLLVPFFLSLILIILGIQALFYLYQEAEQKEFTNNIKSEIEKSFKQQIEQEAEKIEGYLSFIEKSETLKQAWNNQDKELLLKYSSPIYKELNSSNQITHFYFHKLDRTNFLRTHAADKHGDLINRNTLKQAIETGKITAGIEFGTLGQFVLRAVIPWTDKGKLIGYIEIGEEIDHIIDRTASIHNLQIILSVTREYIYKHNLQKTDSFLDRNNSLNKNNHIIINKTLQDIPEKLLDIINKDTSDSSLLKINGSRHLVSSIFIPDFSGENASKLTFLHDFENHIEHRNNILRGTLAITTSTGIVLLIFYFLYSNKLQKSIQSYYDNLKTEINERRKAELELIENKHKLEELVEERNRSLHESKKRYRTLFEKTADALMLLGDNQFIDCNQATLDMFLYNSKEEIFNTHPSMVSPEFQEDGQSSKIKADLMIQTALENGSHRFEWNHVRKNGEVFPAEVLLTAIPSGDTQLLHAVVRDISDRKMAESEIKYRAYYDSLTKLPNRQLLLDRLKQALISSRRKHDFNALLFLDLDRFKTINDSLGHSIGDLLLIETAKRIQSCIREDDTAARFGGDEYVILLKHLGTNQEHASLTAKRISQNILSSFERAFTLKDHQLHVTSSIGINIFPLGNESMEDVIKHADTAMYSAKEQGRNRIAFYLSEMHEVVLKKLNLEKDLRQAISEKKLEVYYQPQVDNTEKVFGVEALIRWQHPEHGFVNPEEFISIAEDTGIIFDIGAFVLEQSLTDMLSLQKENCMPRHISINISPQQFRHPDFIAQIRQHINQYHIEPHFLTLEVTEGIIINNLKETIEKFEQLRKLGVRMSLDDFGTGYSSLSYLKRLPLDELKIDKSFIFDVLKDPHDALLVQTIINIAEQFGLDTVAEGVEEESQLNFLKGKSCKYYQGYYYSRPLPIAQLKEFLLKN